MTATYKNPEQRALVAVRQLYGSREVPRPVKRERLESLRREIDLLLAVMDEEERG